MEKERSFFRVTVLKKNDHKEYLLQFSMLNANCYRNSKIAWSLVRDKADSLISEENKKGEAIYRIPFDKKVKEITQSDFETKRRGFFLKEEVNCIASAEKRYGKGESSPWA